MSKRTPEEKKRRTARNKTRRIEREVRRHPKLAATSPAHGTHRRPDSVPCSISMRTLTFRYRGITIKIQTEEPNPTIDLLFLARSLAQEQLRQQHVRASSQ